MEKHTFITKEGEITNFNGYYIGDFKKTENLTTKNIFKST